MDVIQDKYEAKEIEYPPTYKETLGEGFINRGERAGTIIWIILSIALSFLFSYVLPTLLQKKSPVTNWGLIFWTILTILSIIFFFSGMYLKYVYKNVLFFFSKLRQHELLFSGIKKSWERNGIPDRIPELVKKVEDFPAFLEKKIAYGILIKLEKLIHSKDFWDTLGATPSFAWAWRGKIERINEEIKSFETEIRFRNFDEFLDLWAWISEEVSTLKDTTIHILMYFEFTGGVSQYQKTVYPYGEAWDNKFLKEMLNTHNRNEGFSVIPMFVLEKKIDNSLQDWYILLHILETMDKLDPAWTEIKVSTQESAQMVDADGKHVFSPRDLAILICRNGVPECCVVTDVCRDYSLDVKKSCFSCDKQRLKTLKGIIEGQNEDLKFNVIPKKDILSLMHQSPQEKVFEKWTNNITIAKKCLYIVDITGTLPDNGITTWASSHFARMKRLVLSKAQSSSGTVEVKRIYIINIPQDPESLTIMASELEERLKDEIPVIDCLLLDAKKCDEDEKSDFQVIDNKVLHFLDVEPGKPWTISELVHLRANTIIEFQRNYSDALERFLAIYVQADEDKAKEFESKFKKMEEKATLVKTLDEIKNFLGESEG